MMDWDENVRTDHALRDRFFDKYYPFIRFMAGIYAKRHGIGFRDDFIQEGYFAFLKAIASYDPALGKFSTYLSRQIWNSCRAHKRRALTEKNATSSDSRPPREMLKDEMVARTFVPFVEIISPSGMVGLEVSTEMKHFLDKVKRSHAKYYEFFVLCYVEGRTKVEISKMWNVSPQAVAQTEQAALNWAIGAWDFT